MANALSSVFQARNRANVVIVDQGFGTSRAKADEFAAQMRVEYPKPCTVRVTRYATGPRTATVYCYSVRVYQPK